MKCHMCNQNEANIVFTQIVNNEKIILQLCSECARKKGLSVEIETAVSQSQESILSGLTGPSAHKVETKIPQITCPVCGLTFAEFTKSGLFGCDKCHEAFGEQVTSLLKQIHGTTVHEGKIPQMAGDENNIDLQLKTLRMELKRSVEKENYERAAELRDKITTLERERSIK